MCCFPWHVPIFASRYSRDSGSRMSRIVVSEPTWCAGCETHRWTMSSAEGEFLGDTRQRFLTQASRKPDPQNSSKDASRPLPMICEVGKAKPNTAYHPFVCCRLLQAKTAEPQIAEEPSEASCQDLIGHETWSGWCGMWHQEGLTL